MTVAVESRLSAMLPARQLSVLLVDDHTILREGLRALQSAPDEGATLLNSDMNASQVREFAQTRMTDGAASLLRVAVEQLNLSARAFHRILKLARTIADLENVGTIKAPHLAEAIQYRPRRME